MTSAETEEHARLDHCRTRLQEALRRIEARLDEYAHDVDAQRDYMSQIVNPNAVTFGLLMNACRGAWRHRFQMSRDTPSNRSVLSTSRR